MTRIALLLAMLGLCVAPVSAGPPQIDRTIRKEPVYQTKIPKYGLLMFGPESKDRVWLALDGDTLYVDRNGNGDLTEPGKKVVAQRRPGWDPEEDGYFFEVDDVVMAGRTHKGLGISFTPLKRLASGSAGKRADVKAALAKDPRALAVAVRVEVEMSGLKGDGLDGRVVFLSGPIDLNGVFQFAANSAAAPVVNFSNPLEITFYSELPSVRVGRGSEMVLVVGVPGIGPGTFAMLGYEKTIPRNLNPVVELSLPATTPGGAQVKAKFEIKGRC